MDDSYFSRFTQEVISYLESNLMDELSLRQVVGYCVCLKKKQGCRWGNMCESGGSLRLHSFF